MNWEQIEGKWKEIKEKVIQEWERRERSYLPQAIGVTVGLLTLALVSLIAWRATRRPAPTPKPEGQQHARPESEGQACVEPGSQSRLTS